MPETNINTNFLESSYKNVYPNIYRSLAKFLDKKVPKPAFQVKTVATLRATLTTNQEIPGGSGLNKVTFNRVQQHGNYFNLSNHTWKPPAGQVNLIIYAPRPGMFIFKNGVAVPSTGIDYNYFIVDHSNGDDIFDVRMQSLPDGNFQVYADAALWSGQVYTAVI